MPVGLLDVIAERAFGAGIKVAFAFGRQFVVHPLQDLVGFRHGQPWEGHSGHFQVHAEVFFYGVVEFNVHCLIDMRQPLFGERHHVFMAFNPGDFKVHAGELGHVAGGERGVRPEDRSDFKNAVESGCLCHLLVELRGLRQVGSAVKIFDLEELRAAFTWGSHDFWGMDFDKTVLDPILAHGLLRAGLDLENQAVAFAAQVQIAPVHAVILVRQGVGEGFKRQGEFGVVFHHQRFELDFDAAELHHRVFDNRAGDGQRGLGSEFGDGFRQFRIAFFPVRHLHQPGGVAHDEKLHAFLIAQGLQPAFKGNLTTNFCLQVSNIRSLHWSYSDDSSMLLRLYANNRRTASLGEIERSSAAAIRASTCSVGTFFLKSLSRPAIS